MSGTGRYLALLTLADGTTEEVSYLGVVGVDGSLGWTDFRHMDGSECPLPSQASFTILWNVDMLTGKQTPVNYDADAEPQATIEASVGTPRRRWWRRPPRSRS